MLVDEFINLGPMFAITDTRPDDNFIEQGQVCLRGLVDRHQADLISVLFDYLLQSPADGQGMSIGGGIENKDPGHFCDDIFLVQVA